MYISEHELVKNNSINYFLNTPPFKYISELIEKSNPVVCPVVVIPSTSDLINLLDLLSTLYVHLKIFMFVQRKKIYIKYYTTIYNIRYPTIQKIIKINIIVLRL